MYRFVANFFPLSFFCLSSLLAGL